MDNRRLKINNNIKNSEFRDNEDLPVIEFLNTLNSNEISRLIEIGSGNCRFVDKIRKSFNQLEITCFEINPDLAAIAERNGYLTINENFLNNCLKSESYDIVHCSHVIEHFGYPDVANFINELFRIIKPGGYCIIRSPLMWSKFFDDLDHVRPYPPISILNYLNLEQQQIKGVNKVRTIKIWYRSNPKIYNSIDKSSLLYILPFKKVINYVIDVINKLSVFLWNRYRFPATKPNGYVAIFKKIY